MTEVPGRQKHGKQPLLWLASVIVLSLFVRAALWFTYEPVEYSDSGAYFRLATALQDYTLSGYDGSRVPGYPLLINLLGSDPGAIWFVQMFFGVLTASLLFWIAWRTTSSVRIGSIVGGLQAVFPASVLFEANMLTETLTLTLITLTIALFLAYNRAEASYWKFALACLLGLSASVVGMVRPIFFPLTFWILPFVWFVSDAGWKPRLINVIIYALFPLILQGGWLYYMKTHYRVISPTAIGGYSMVQHSGEFFESLPDEHAAVRDVYIEYRDEQIEARGSQNNAIWQAVPALTESTGLNFYELSRRLSRLSWKLIREHPVGYAVNVIEGWIWFWKAPVYWRADLISNSAVRSAIQIWVLLGRWMAVMANLAFLLIGSALVISQKVREWVKIDPMLVLVGGFIGWTSILQSLFEHGDNPRFLVPLQMFVIYFVVRSFYFMRQRLIKTP
jgi:hypothetical protein